MIPTVRGGENLLLTLCFDALVERVVCVGTERFIAVMNREPEDYTHWREETNRPPRSPLLATLFVRSVNPAHPFC